MTAFVLHPLQKVRVLNVVLYRVGDGIVLDRCLLLDHPVQRFPCYFAVDQSRQLGVVLLLPLDPVLFVHNVLVLHLLLEKQSVLICLLSLPITSQFSHSFFFFLLLQSEKRIFLLLSLVFLVDIISMVKDVFVVLFIDKLVDP